jgi:single-strand DNA-binding protein
MNYNRIEIIGNLGRDVEVKEFASGSKLATFSVAVKQKEKEGDEFVDKTQWYDVAVWGKLGEICETILQKGSKVFVAGTFSIREWSDKDGNNRYTAQVKASEVIGLSPKAETEEVSKPSAPVSEDKSPF